MKKILFSFLIIAGVIIGIWYLVSNNTVMITGDVEVVMDSLERPSAVMAFQLNQPMEVYVKYWLDDNENKPMYTPVSLKAIKHSVPLLCLKGEKSYRYKIIAPAQKENQSKESEIGFFTTQKFSKVMLQLPWSKKLKKGFDGYILSQRSLGIRRLSKAGEENGYLFLTDSSGTPVWYQDVPELPKLSQWTDNGTILVISGKPEHERSAGDLILEYDLYGNQLVRIDLNSRDTPTQAHHEIRYSHDGNLLTLIYDERSIDFSASGGKRGQMVKGDAIVKMSKEGKILWKWSVFDVLDPLTSQFKVDSVGEWGHANALSLDLDGNYLVSFRDWNQIWKINSTDGSLIWKLGVNGDFYLPEGFSFSGQHSIHINNKGQYMMFNNGVQNKASSVVTFTIDEKNRSARIMQNIQLPETFYSEKRGSAYYIDNENILVCSPDSKSVLIVNEAGDILARASTGLPDYYRAVYVPQLYPLEHINR